MKVHPQSNQLRISELSHCCVPVGWSSQRHPFPRWSSLFSPVKIAASNNPLVACPEQFVTGGIPLRA